MAAAEKKGLTLYTASTPNSVKISVALEELGLKYNVHKLVLADLDQKQDWFLKINPNGRVPAIVDHENDNLPVFESGAILLYLCDRYDTEGLLLPKDTKQRSEVIQWLMFQMGGLGPMQGQAHHFVRYAPETFEYARDHFVSETKRHYGVLENRLEQSNWLAAGQYTIADIACYCWVWIGFWGAIDVSEFPKVQEWASRVNARDAVRRGLDVPEPNTLKESLTNPEMMRKRIARARLMMVSTEPPYPK